MWDTGSVAGELLSGCEAEGGCLVEGGEPLGVAWNFSTAQTLQMSWVLAEAS